MGLRVPSLADMDALEVSRKRKPVKLSNATRSVNVILWRVDGSAAVVAHSRRTTNCCTNTIWRRMMCARHHVGRNKQQCHSRETEDADDENLDHDFLELGEPHQSPLMKEVGSKLQSSFNIRRWPQGWI